MNIHQYRQLSHIILCTKDILETFFFLSFFFFFLHTHTSTAWVLHEKTTTKQHSWHRASSMSFISLLKDRSHINLIPRTDPQNAQKNQVLQKGQWTFHYDKHYLALTELGGETSYHAPWIISNNIKAWNSFQTSSYRCVQFTMCSFTLQALSFLF